MWRWAVMTMLREAEVNEGEGAQGAWSKQHRGVSHNLWSDRQSLKSACGFRVCRPLRAVCRRLLEVSAAVAIVAEVEPVHRRIAHRGLGSRRRRRGALRRRRIMKEADGLNDKGIFLYGWEERGDCRLAPTVGGRAAARHRRAGKASGGFGLTAKRKRADTIGLPEVSGIARV